MLAALGLSPSVPSLTGCIASAPTERLTNDRQEHHPELLAKLTEGIATLANTDEWRR